MASGPVQLPALLQDAADGRASALLQPKVPQAKPWHEAMQRPFRPQILRRAAAKFATIKWAFAGSLPTIFGLLRFGSPIFRLPCFSAFLMPWCNLVIVSRYDHVQEVLSRPDVFRVPFGQRMRELDPTGTDFILGLDDGDAYHVGLRRVMQVLRLDDIPRLARTAAHEAQTLLSSCDGEVDAAGGLLWRVPTRLCRSYFGLPIADTDEHAFALWTMAMSNYTFDVLGRNVEQRELALAGADRVAHVMRAAINGTKAAAKAGAEPDTVVGRMVALQRGDPAFTDEMIRATLTGLTTGFIPTSSMPAANALEVLLKRPPALAMAQQAARAGDDDLLERCLFEAMRFKPLHPGPIRWCSEDATLAADTFWSKRVRKGRFVLASTQSAMLDPRRVTAPARFDPYRPACDSMLFGFGLHWCVGAPIARAQITQTLKPLLRRGNLRRAPGTSGRTKYFGAFPERMLVQFGR